MEKWIPHSTAKSSHFSTQCCRLYSKLFVGYIPREVCQQKWSFRFGVRARSLCFPLIRSGLKDDIRLLRRELSDAVDQEDYFKAASLRDEIFGLEEKDPVISIQKELENVVQEEKYEIAAQLRDKLRAMDTARSKVEFIHGTTPSAALEIKPISCSSDVITRGIRIRVRSFYVEHLSAAAQGKYVFAYQVEITNEGDEAVQLKNRSWTIMDARGNTEKTGGTGVIGQQPIIAPGHYFQYMSICPLETSFGTMEGYYEMVVINRHQHETFYAEIGKFGLDVNMHRHVRE